MTSSSALPNFNWSVSTPPSNQGANALSSELDAGSSGSFQNILTNAVGQFAYTSPAMPNSSSASANWTTLAASSDAPNDATAVGANESPNYSANGPNSEQDGNSTPSSPLSSNPLQSPFSGAVKTNNPALAKNTQVGNKQTTSKVDKKVDELSHPLHAEASGGVAGRAEPQHAAAVNNRAAAQDTTPDRSTDVGQALGSANMTLKTGLPSLPGLSASNGLPGAALALHITPTGNRSAAAQKSPAGAPGPAQIATAMASANPSANTVIDPSALSGGITDPASLPTNALMMANIGTARSRQVSALGPNVASAESVPWSAPTSSPALVNDSSESTESVTAPVPVAEVDMEDPASAAQPVRTLQLQLGGGGGQRVDLRLVEHAGGLSVSVRASDSNLTRGLQENLPELSSRLAEEHYQTEAWLPAAGQTSTGGHSSSSSEQPPNPRGGGQSAQGGSSSSGGQGSPQQGRQQNQPPAWWRQLAALEGTSTSTSVLNPNYFKEK